MSPGGTAILLMAIAAGASASQEPIPHPDSIRAERAEASHRFNCGNSVTRLRYAELLRERADLALVDRWRVSLISISVSGRRISAQDRARLGAAMHDFAWIDRVSVRCTRFNREVYLDVLGMPAERWASYGRGDVRQRPDRHLMTVTISDRGAVTIS